MACGSVERSLSVLTFPRSVELLPRMEEEEAGVNLDSVMKEENDYLARRQEDMHEESIKDLGRLAAGPQQDIYQQRYLPQLPQGGVCGTFYQA